MVMTVLEGLVAKEKWTELSAAYEAGLTRMPPQMVQSFLVQGQEEPTLWRGISIWPSRVPVLQTRLLDRRQRFLAPGRGVERKVLTPNDVTGSADLADRLLAFQARYEEMAIPFEWKFTRVDLAKLLRRLDAQNLPAAAVG